MIDVNEVSVSVGGKKQLVRDTAVGSMEPANLPNYITHRRRVVSALGIWASYSTVVERTAFGAGVSSTLS